MNTLRFTMFFLIFSMSVDAQTEYQDDVTEDATEISEESKIEHDYEFDRSFDYWDTDDDGTLETENYTSGVRERYDSDASGTVSLNEWRSVNRSEGDNEFFITDVNSDGQIDSIEWSGRLDAIKNDMSGY